MISAEIHTPKGVMKAILYDDDAPGTVANFVKLAKTGFYDGLAFHRVIPDFVIQGGCPYSIDITDPRVGTGGPGYKIKCELNGQKQYHDRGVMSMAHAGKDTGGSQFFICHSRSKDIKSITLDADIIIAALGVPEFLKGDMVKEGAVVIDVGITRVKADNKAGFKLKGDVLFDEVAPKCSYITPVPGGVGPMTIVSLLKNTLRASGN